MAINRIMIMQGWCPWCGDHMAGGGWGMMFGWGLILVVLVLLVLAVVRGNWWRSGGNRGGGNGDPAETALREEYARGTIDEETYRRRLQELRRS